MKSTQNIALLVFAYSPEEEKKHKPFLRKGGLANSLDNHIHEITKKSCLPVIYFDEHLQIGHNFNARFANAFAQTFSQGYDAIISIGNDSPGLNAHHIFEAEEALRNGRTVLGPSFDGGLYLVGISKENFDYHQFSNFSWGSAFLFEEFKEKYQSAHYNCLILEKIADIDQLLDLGNLSLTNINNARLRSIILSIKAWVANISSDIQIKTLEKVLSITPNKGSPLCLAFNQ